MTDFYRTALWDGATRDLDAERQAETFTRSKVASAAYWPFLAAATSRADFDQRLALAADRIEAVCEPLVLDKVMASLVEDFEAMQEGASHEAQLHVQAASKVAEGQEAMTYPAVSMYAMGGGGYRVDHVASPEFAKTFHTGSDEDQAKQAARQFALSQGMPLYVDGHRVEGGLKPGMEYFHSATGTWMPVFPPATAAASDTLGETRDALKGLNEVCPGSGHYAGKGHTPASTVGFNKRLSTQSHHCKHCGQDVPVVMADKGKGYAMTHWAPGAGIFDKQATFTPDPSDAARYQSYPPTPPSPTEGGSVAGPTGAPMGPDGFPPDVSEGEQRSQIGYQRQLTPVPWTVTPGSEWRDESLPNAATGLPQGQFPTANNAATGSLSRSARWALGFNHASTGHAQQVDDEAYFDGYTAGLRTAANPTLSAAMQRLTNGGSRTFSTPNGHSYSVQYHAEQALGDDNKPAPGYTTGAYSVYHDQSGQSLGHYRHSPYNPDASWSQGAKRYAADQAAEALERHARSRTSMNAQRTAGSLKDMTYHESYGPVSREQLRAYKKFNVSQSDHDDIEDHFGRSSPETSPQITKHVIDNSSSGMYRPAWGWQHDGVRRVAGEGIVPTPGPNPNYFSQGSDGLQGPPSFPEDPAAGIEPKTDNRMDDVYGDVPPQVSSGSASEGQFDGQGYSKQMTSGRRPFAESAGERTAAFGDQHVSDYVNWAKGEGHDPDHAKTLKRYEKLPGIGRAHADHIADQLYIGDGTPQWRQHHEGVRHTAPGGGEHAPYRIQKVDGGYAVFNDKGERKNDEPKSHDEARQFQKALYKNVPGASESAKEDEAKKTAATDGRIVGHCDNCHAPVRWHDGSEGKELRHLHSNKNSCDHGGIASQAVRHVFFDPHDASIHTLAQGATQMPPQMPNPVQPDDQSPESSASTGAVTDTNVPTADPTQQNQMTSSHHLADAAFQAPTAENPTGRGEDEYRARNWDSLVKQRPMQRPEERNVNTPVLPAEQIRTLDTDGPRERNDQDEDETENQGADSREASWVGAR
jgi:hypothetical protein